MPEIRGELEKVSFTEVEERVIVIPRQEVVWPFDRETYCLTKPRRYQWEKRINVAAYPCYPHDWDTVVLTALTVEAWFPIGFVPNYYLVPNDDPTHCQGFAQRDYI